MIDYHGCRGDQMDQLKNRLNALRQQRVPAPLAQGESLAKRVRRRRPMADQRQAQPRPDDEHVASLIGGQRLDHGLVLVQRSIPLQNTHGNRSLLPLLDMSLEKFIEPYTRGSESLLFMDTETTGLAGGTGTLVFLLGLARLEGRALSVRQYFLTSFAGEAAMLEDAAQWIRRQDILVTYNGKSFDGPLLATRFRLARVEDPFADLDHLDLVHPTRRAFANLWPDCRLGTAEEKLLAFERQDDLPGEQVPQVWFEFVRGGVTTRVPAVLAHNYWDLISLAGLLPSLAAVYDDPGSMRADVLAVARHALKRGYEHEAVRHLELNRAVLTHDGLLELARIYRRRQRWDAAVAIWEQLAPGGCAESLQRLAKYFEHIKRNYPHALRCTESLIELEMHCHSHLQRKRRLVRKMA